MSRYGWLFPLLILAVLLLSSCQWIVAPEEMQPEEVQLEEVQPEEAQLQATDCTTVRGAWVGTFSGGPWDTPLIFQNTIAPQDPAGKKLLYVMRLVNPDATFGMPELAEANTMSDLVGEAVKTGSGTYDVSLLGYGVKERPGDRGEIIYLWTVNGSLACQGEDNMLTDVTLAVYTADQDENQDGIPDEGAAPICIGPTDFGTAQRVPQMPRCEPSQE